MRINLERTWSTDGQVILNLELHANREEHGLFQQMGFTDINTSDQLLSRYFQDHDELYKSIEIDSALHDSFHSFDTQFSNACSGFAKFLEALTPEHIDGISEAITRKVNTEMNQRFHSIASSRVISLSPVKKLPAIKFPSVEKIVRLQIGNEVFDLNPVTMPKSEGIIESIRTSADEVIGTTRGLFEESSRNMVESVEQQYKQEIDRLNREHQNMIPFPQWIHRDAIRTSNIQMYYKRGLILFVLPFHFKQTHVKVRENVYELKDKFSVDTHDTKLVISVQNKRVMWMRLINKNFNIYPNMHTTGDSLCLGSYRMPKDEIGNVSQLMKIRDEVQEVLTVVNTDSLGSTDPMSDEQRTIRHYARDEDTRKQVIKTNVDPKYVHAVGFIDN